MAMQEMPKHRDLLWPTLKALEVRGGSASIQELVEQIADDMNIPDFILERLHSDGPRTEVEYRAAWARTGLKNVGAIENTSRGIWTITEKGRRIQSEDEVRELVRIAKLERQNKKREASVGCQRGAVVDLAEDDETEEDEAGWQDALLDVLRKMEPGAFERLCQRILRESGFTKVEVTGRSGDGGIDGAGVLRVNLISFHVRFQCKRYTGSVGAPDIRDFRGAMVGRADKGLFMTTGNFTKEAEREAVRDGAPAIDLVSGSELCNLLKELRLGVTLETVEVAKPEPEFFAKI